MSCFAGGRAVEGLERVADVGLVSKQPADGACVSGASVVRLMTARRVQVTWSSQSLRMSWRSASSFVETLCVACSEWSSASVRGRVVPAGEGECDERTEERDQRRQRKGDRTGGMSVFMSVLLSVGRSRRRLLCRAGEGESRREAGRLDDLGGDRETVDRLGLRVQEREPGGDRQPVAHEQAREQRAPGESQSDRGLRGG